MVMEQVEEKYSPPCRLCLNPYCTKYLAHKRKRETIRVGKWKKENADRVKEYNRKYNREYRRKLRLNPRKRLDDAISRTIWQVLKGKKAGRKWESLVEYKLEKLVSHLEKQFEGKMNWENYGTYWWVDHIIPKSRFKYETAGSPEFKKCWALKNLRPMEKIANIKKNNKFQ